MPEPADAALDRRARLRREAMALLPRLRGSADSALLGAARAQLDALKEQREFRLLGQLAEEVRRHDPKDATLRRLHAQSLIETGRVTAAVDVLSTLARGLRRDDVEWAEARGLLGRAHKQIFFDAEDKTSPAALTALRRSIENYRAPFEADPERNSWHGVNLVALLRKARAVAARFGRDLDPEAIARDIVQTLARVPAAARDNWYHATAAEAELALDHWDEAEAHIGAYVQDERTTAFNLGSTLRQFTEVWDLEETERGQGIVDALRGRVMMMKLGGERPDEPGGVVHLKPEQLQRAVSAPVPAGPQLQAILGPDGPRTYKWWRTGMERARSVASLRLELLGRFGTGFLVRGGDLVPALGDELLVLTNWHVVNPQGLGDAMPPEAVEVSFEADDPEQGYPVREVVWSSPFDQHDASLLRLQEPPAGIPPLPFARGSLPDVSGETKPRVYAIGHPGGRELSFSFADNELLDHEGPPVGKPLNAEVCRLHYRTPTEQGSSGSPVFEGSGWRILALHHAGGREIPRLNGVLGVWDANEGVSIECIRIAMQKSLG
jgi:tetratricopeptide (TPR) repeat protein